MKNSTKYLVTLFLFYLAIAIASVITKPAYALNHGFPSSATTKWFESQKMPPDEVVSCCGKADAYPVDDYEKLPNGDYKVWIVDGSAIQYPDGSRRVPWDTKIPVIVPAGRVNKLEDDLDNPTDHGWLFFKPIIHLGADGTEMEPSTDFVDIYCFVRHPNGI